MPLYKYLAAEAGTPPREIIIEADTPAEAMTRLRRKNMFPIRELGEVSAMAGGKFQWRRKKIDVFGFTGQLAPLLSSHIPLERALMIIAESAEHADQKDFVTSLRQGLHEGKKFSQLVRSHGAIFPGYYANLIESGEESGCLPEVVVELQRFMRENRETREFIVSSSIYPAVVLGVVLLVIILLFVVFVPMFTRIFLDMGRELPPSMVFLNVLSTIFCWGIPSVILLAIGAWFGLPKIYGKERITAERDRLLLKAPFLGSLIVTMEMCRFIQTLAILIANHVEIIRTVKIATRVLLNSCIRNDFADLERHLKGGLKLSAGLARSVFVPRTVIQMVRVGEESGTVGEMLRDITGQMEEGVRRRIKRALSLFEPLVIIVLALVVLVVVVAIFLAIMDLNAINA